jgi:hypothetical protein
VDPTHFAGLGHVEQVQMLPENLKPSEQLKSPAQQAAAPTQTKEPADLCVKIRSTAVRFNIANVPDWVRHNCAFTRTFFPFATCDQINQIVAECFRIKATAELMRKQ